MPLKILANKQCYFVTFGKRQKEGTAKGAGDVQIPNPIQCGPAFRHWLYLISAGETEICSSVCAVLLQCNFLLPGNQIHTSVCGCCGKLVILQFQERVAFFYGKESYLERVGVKFQNALSKVLLGFKTKPCNSPGFYPCGF